MVGLIDNNNGGIRLIYIFHIMSYRDLLVVVVHNQIIMASFVNSTDVKAQSSYSRLSDGRDMAERIMSGATPDILHLQFSRQ